MRSYFCLLALPLFALFSPAQEIPKQDPDDHAAARDEWFYSQRQYPLGQIPAGARVKAIEAIKNIERATSARNGSLAAGRDATSDPNNWSLIGPRPTDAGSTYVTAGRVNAIAIDPRDNNTVYIGAAEGGVWKTTDGGQNWTPLTDDQASLANGSIAIDPINPDIVYVGTGEENFAIDSYYGAGILKSTDGGQHWTNIVGPFLRATIGSLAIHPANGQIVLAGVGTIGGITASTLTRGVWRSTDGGQNWTQVLTGAPATSVLFDPSNGNTAYAALGLISGSGSNGVYKSTDAGKTWTLIPGSGANALPTANVGRIDIGIAPSNSSTLFASIQDSSSSTFGGLLGVFKTTDGGATWNKLSPPNVCAGVGQCWYDMNIRVNPKDPNVVFLVGSLRVARSLDGGATWSTIPLTGSNNVQMHVD